MRDVVVRAILGRGSLRAQDPVEVPVVWVATRSRSVALALRLGHEGPERTWLLARLRRPVQTVALARTADETLGILMQAVRAAILRIVVPLGVHVREAD